MVMKMKIIVPIMAKNRTEAAAQAAKLREHPGADWVELRLDPLPAADWRDTLTAVRAAVGDKPLIVTIRTSRTSFAGIAFVSLRALSSVSTCRTLLTGIAFFAFQICGASARRRSDSQSGAVPRVSSRYSIRTSRTLSASVAFRTSFSNIPLGSLGTSVALITFLSL